MAGQPNTDAKTDGGKPPDKPAKKPRLEFWRWLILHTERQMHQRRSRREKKKSRETQEDRAANLTANATFWIAIFTIV